MRDVNLGFTLEVDMDSLDKALREVREECRKIVRGITVMAWKSILSRTPQFHGRMAASWNYSIGSPNYEDRSDQAWSGRSVEMSSGPVRGLWRGHPEAIGIANAANKGNDRYFALGDTVYISNGVDHGEGPYAYDVEVGNVLLRPYNMPGQPVKRAVDMIANNFRDDVSVNKAARLKTLRVAV